MELEIKNLKRDQKVWVQSRWAPGVKPCEVTVTKVNYARNGFESDTFEAEHGEDAGSPNSIFSRAWDSQKACAQEGSLHLWNVANTAQEQAEMFDREFLA